MTMSKHEIERALIELRLSNMPPVPVEYAQEASKYIAIEAPAALAWLSMTALMPSQYTVSPFASLDAQGLNLQAIFNLQDLPVDVLSGVPVEQRQPYRQLLLIGHRGALLWQQLCAQGLHGEHPVDEFSRAQVAAWMASAQPGRAYRFIFPGPAMIGLQRLGALAGWHHASPFMVGINALWGSWFAYRAVVLADTELAPTPALDSSSPCHGCATRVCVSQCPAHALEPVFDLNACLDYRRQSGSACQNRCLARNSCPVGREHRYSEAQISYHYGRSLQAL